MGRHALVRAGPGRRRRPGPGERRPERSALSGGLLLRDNYGWPELAQHYWLDTASFGVEFGPPSGDPTDSGPSRFSAQISAYCLDVRITLLTAAAAVSARWAAQPSAPRDGRLTRATGERGGARQRPREVLGEGADLSPEKVYVSRPRRPCHGRRG